jgi:hypothetical protein
MGRPKITIILPHIATLSLWIWLGVAVYLLNTSPPISSVDFPIINTSCYQLVDINGEPMNLTKEYGKIFRGDKVQVDEYNLRWAGIDFGDCKPVNRYVVDTPTPPNDRRW